jgi:hypothetical protein
MSRSQKRVLPFMFSDYYVYISICPVGSTWTTHLNIPVPSAEHYLVRDCWNGIKGGGLFSIWFPLFPFSFNTAFPFYFILVPPSFLSFEVLTEVAMWDVTPYSLVKFCQCWRKSLESKQAFPLLTACQLSFRPWRWRHYVPLKRQQTFTRLHGVTSSLLSLFICYYFKARACVPPALILKKYSTGSRGNALDLYSGSPRF